MNGKENIKKDLFEEYDFVTVEILTKVINSLDVEDKCTNPETLQYLVDIINEDKRQARER
ncbi:hypothetical protein QNH39_18545 [Neobacillus novalis]|uniref:Uncharacterized protein n=1 Tax=Neobacillus novalis TaxID=220687 RepID=A0AA95MM85_9BACI|nr:hypothetical protein [Neobacillus novalis]WHY84638.1 hypothetical protein QNH39_18545 [Neobacillus novalis]